jgi:single-stranded-DNA-specific exonuclease
VEVIWRKRHPHKPDKPHGLHREQGADMALPPLIADLLFSRGICSSESIDALLSPKLSQLHDPFSLQNLQKASLRFVEAFKKNEKIAIYGDFDLDGTSGLALFKLALESLGFEDLLIYQPSRLTEGYGLHTAAIDKLKEQGCSLIITIDLGITAVEAAKHCQNLGIELIISDHHLAQDVLPECYALINPNAAGCLSGLGYLCGAGVAFYLAWGIKREMIKAGLASEISLDLKEILDCFVIGTLTDMVPLIDDNRTLVKMGLKKLAQTKRPGLRLLLGELGLWGRPLSSQDVAIRFAPKLNALSRMELGIRPLDLFLVEDEAKALEMVQQVMKNNSLRVELQGEAEKSALEMAELWRDEKFIFVSSDQFHKGIIGLVATKLSQTFSKPAFVGTIENGSVVGSARAPTGFNLVRALESASEAFVRFGGHAQAAGFEFHPSSNKEEQICSKLKEYFSIDTRDEHSILEIEFDIEARISEINPAFMDWLDALGPFGMSFESPLLFLKSVGLKNWRALRGGHIRLTLQDQPGFSKTLDGLLFSPLNHQLEIAQNHSLVDVLVEPQWNYYMGNRTIQLLVKEIRPSLEV